MVVVAIIALLLMLLIPNIRAMREKALSTQCQNNLRQYGIAMGQYMADHGGYFIYPGFGDRVVKDGTSIPGSQIGDFDIYDRRAVKGSTVGGSAGDNWLDGFIDVYIYKVSQATLASISAGKPALQVCPALLRDLRVENYFDPKSPNFKGEEHIADYYGQPRDMADFEDEYGRGYNDLGDLRDGYQTNFLDNSFTTYAINPLKIRQHMSTLPHRVVAFIDWNAREGWGANLYNTTAKYKFNSPDGTIRQEETPKWTNAWWLTEVGFHHRVNNEYGANYVAMDGHVGWISSNAISITNFNEQ